MLYTSLHAHGLPFSVLDVAQLHEASTLGLGGLGAEEKNNHAHSFKLFHQHWDLGMGDENLLS